MSSDIELRLHDVGQCPGDALISEYLQGLLSEPERANTDAHLDQCDECRSLVSQLAKSTQLAKPQEVESGLPPGTMIAEKYEILQTLAEGGMGIVYLAKQPGLQRTVAIKLMRAGIEASVDAAVRFTREARIAARLSSPHVVNVLDIGMTEQGQPFIVMEHLRGFDLDEYIQRQAPLPLEEAIDLVRQLCLGLQEAHNAGVVHRDLKPGNVYLVPQTQGGMRAILLDFGVSKLSGEAEMDLTQTGTVMGSPRYMAPEQLADSKKVDQRADLWSVGVILYELLAGTPPYRSTTLIHLVAEILKGKPQSIQELRPEVPTSLARVLDRCFEKDPSLRFESADALSAALANIGPTRRGQAVAISASIAIPPRRRNRAVLAIAGLLAVPGIVVGLSLSSVGSDDLSESDNHQEQPPAAPALVMDAAFALPSDAAVENVEETPPVVEPVQEVAPARKKRPRGRGRRPGTKKRRPEVPTAPKTLPKTLPKTSVDDDELLNIPL